MSAAKLTTNRAAFRTLVGLGEAGAFVVIAFGAFSLAKSFAAGVVLLVMGFSLFIAADGELRALQLAGRLEGRSAAELAYMPVWSIAPDASVNRALEQLATMSDPILPVMLEERLLGVVVMGQAVQAQAEGAGEAYVTSIMTRAEALVTLAPAEPALAAWQRLTRSHLPCATVLDEDGSLRGFFTRLGALRQASQKDSPRDGCSPPPGRARIGPDDV